MKSPFGKMIIGLLTFLCLGSQLWGQEITVAEQQHLEDVAKQRKFVEDDGNIPTVVTGKAVLPDGSPAVGFKIGGWSRCLTHANYGFDDFATTTDQDGRFTLDVYRPFAYWVSITDPDDVYVAFDRHFELTEQPETDTICFQLQKGISVEGTVLDQDNNEPIAGLSVWLIHKPVFTSVKEFGGLENMFEHEKTQQCAREVKTDSEGKFRFTCLPLEYMISLNRFFGAYRPVPQGGELDLYARFIHLTNGPLHVEFRIPSPWFGQVLQKDGTPASFYPIEVAAVDCGFHCITDKNGQFMVYKPLKMERITVDTPTQNQWFFKKYDEEILPNHSTFHLNTPISASGKFVRKSTGKPLANFKFACQPRPYYMDMVMTDENGKFEVPNLFLGCETTLRFSNPLDPNGCSTDDKILTFIAETPDTTVDLGVIELEESEFLDPNMMEKFIGQHLEIEGITLDDHAFDWKKYKGKVVLVDFWATWCGPCLLEIPNLKAMYEKYHDHGFDIVGISIDVDLDSLKRGMERFQFPWTILADKKRDIAGQESMYDRFKIRSIPRCFLIDRDGKVISVEARGEKLEAELEKLFGK